MSSSSNFDIRAQEVITLWKRRFRPSLQDHLGWYRSAGSLDVAIQRAAKAEDSAPNRRNSHQRRLPRSAPEKIRKKLSLGAGEIEKCRDFESLYAIVDQLIRDEFGVGDLMVYDTALRIGAYLSFRPNRVFLQCGALAGANRYFSLIGANRKPKSGSSLPVSEFPHFANALLPHEIEHMLCTMRDCFDPEASVFLPIRKTGC